MNCVAYGDPRRELFNTLKEETKLYLDSMTPSSAFATLISMKQGEKTVFHSVNGTQRQFSRGSKYCLEFFYFLRTAKNDLSIIVQVFAFHCPC